jgi:hypothetical protein
MIGQDEIETRLIEAMAVNPSAAVIRRLDDRVSAMLAAPTTRRAPFDFGRLMRPLTLAVGLALTVGAVGAAITIIDRLAEESSPGWQAAWERAEILGIQQADAGLTLTLERAYVDVNQVLLGISIDGLDALPSDGSRNEDMLSWHTELRGPGGWTIQPEESSNVARVVEGTRSAFIFTFGAPPQIPGSWELSVTSVGYGAGAMTDGAWTFAFELPEPAGTVVTDDASDTVGDATLTLTELRISPSIVVARVGLVVDGTTVASWSPGTGQDGEVIRHGDEAYQIVEEAIYAATPSENEYLTDAGAEDAAGTWEIVIPELGYTNREGQPVSVIGPWTLTVTVP